MPSTKEIGILKIISTDWKKGVLRVRFKLQENGRFIRKRSLYRKKISVCEKGRIVGRYVVTFIYIHMMKDEQTMKHDICPWYLGYILANPLRRLYQNPEKIVSPYCKPGMRVLEIGPGMGFFSLPMAEKVGSGGKIFCVDVQEEILRAIRRKVVRREFDSIIETRLCSESSLEISDIKGTIDFALDVPLFMKFQMQIFS